MFLKSLIGAVLVLAFTSPPPAWSENPPLRKIADTVSECSPVLNGDWICQSAQSGRRSHMNLSLKTDGGGVARLVKRYGGACRGCHYYKTIYVADGRRHVDEEGLSYAASCNHRTKTKGYKIFRIAYRLPPGKVRIQEYVIMDDGRMVYGGFFGTMDGWDVKNSDRPPEPDGYSICAKLE